MEKFLILFNNLVILLPVKPLKIIIIEYILIKL